MNIMTEIVLPAAPNARGGRRRVALSPSWRNWAVLAALTVLAALFCGGDATPFWLAAQAGYGGYMLGLYVAADRAGRP